MDGQEDSKKLAQEESIGFPILSDPDLATIDAYGLRAEGRDIAVPAVYVIRSDGTVAYRHVGENVKDRPEIDAVLGALSVAKR